ncbi:MAG TPA: YafY family protein [Ktedonobacterales bacterium]|jgi:predicted DNA-binding transcriptional regulator YafY
MAHAAYSPATRLLALLDLLQSRPRLSAEQLADALQVNTRSARRYVTMLQDMGIPVEARRGRYGGYALRPGYKLPPLMLTDDEALAITLGLLAAPRLGLAEMQAATTGALAKLERVLPLQTRERVQAIRDAVALDTPSAQAAPVRFDHIALCSAATRQRRRLWLTYRRSDGSQSERLLDCYGVVYHDERWYAIGYCLLRQQVRVFRLDRMLEIALRDERFTPPPGFDCLAYAITAFAAIPDTWLVQALLDMPFAQACRQTPPTFATLEEAADGTLLRAYDNSLDHAARFLIGLGCPFQVIGPPELLDTLAQLARDLAAMVARATAPIAH